MREYSQPDGAMASEFWQLGKTKPGKPLSLRRLSLLREALGRTRAHGAWVWPEKPVVFISDPHADADAFEASLRAAGCYTAGRELTSFGREARIVIGGDCLDKGPSNLELLRSIKALFDSGADVTLLAGNHDVRLLLGLQSLALGREVDHEHLFLRMGPKVVPLLREVFEEHMRGRIPDGLPDEQSCRQALYPRDHWEQAFTAQYAERIGEEMLERECRGIRRKRERFAAACAKAQMSWRAVYATALHCQRLFLQPAGEFSWFFRQMQLYARDGSFLFVHAGLDDAAAAALLHEGHEPLNERFRQEMQQRPFQCYLGPLANSLRTKYRSSNLPLTDAGVEHAYRAGIYAVVHGHRNRTDGQRMMLRQGLLHFEADITLDRHSRAKEGLSGLGVGLTLIEPGGRVVGLSNDYPSAKVFQPQALLHRTDYYHAVQQERLSA